MRKMSKLLSVFMAFLLLFTTVSFTAFASDDTSASGDDKIVIKLQIDNPIMTVNGREQSIDENGTVSIIQNGRTLLPVRAVVEVIGGTLFKIETVTPYPVGYEDTKVIAPQVKESNARPALTATVANMDSYDTVFLSYPIWYGTNPMAINTFVENYDLSGKTIIPFCTNEGNGLGGSVSDIKKLCPESTFLEGLAVRGSDAQNAQSSVVDWLDRIGVPPVSESKGEENNMTNISIL